MKNDRKTKNELIDELEYVRRKVKRLETLLEKRKHTKQDVMDRLHTGRDLRESEEKFSAAFYTSPNLMVITRISDGTILEVNDGYSRLLGYSRTESIGKTTAELSIWVDPKDRITFITSLENSGKITDFETTLRRKDGTLITVIDSAQAIQFQGEMCVLSVIYDITKRKQAEEALVREQFLMNMLMDNVPDHIYFKDKESRFIRMNKSLAMSFKLRDPAEAVGKTDFDFFTEQHARPAFEDEQKIIRTGQPIIGLEEKETWPDGSETWVTTTKMPLRDKEGEIIGTFGISKDITERKQAEEALQESEVRYRSVLQSATDAIVTADGRGIIIGWNRGAERIFGYSYTEAVGQPFTFIVPLYHYAGHSDGIKKFLSEEDRYVIGKTVELKGLRKDKGVFPIEISLSTWEANSEQFFTGIIRDITNRKLLEEQMRQMQKLEELGTLAGGIAHDFNNILGIILGYITSIKRFKDDTKKLDLAVDAIMKAVDRGKTLVQQILTFARKKEITFGAVNVNDIVMEIMTMILETFPRTLTYSQNFDKAIPNINADRSQLYQILLNLCVNARDAMPKGGVLTINTRIVSVASLRNLHPDAIASSYICIEVSDTGEGMTPEVRSRIFEPFFTTKEHGKGTGLGLAIVFGVVQIHKGFIDVESKLGEGTTFRLYLPTGQVAEPISIKEEETLENIPGGTETLLVVEDEEMLLMPLQTVLVEKGYKVLSAGDGFTALKIYQERKDNIALVITDLGLPNISGLEVCKRIKGINPNEHMILATGFLDPEMKSELLKARVQHFLYKPYDFNEVLKAVREVLDEK